MAELNDKLISFGNLSYFQTKLLNNEAISDKSTWSSEKINAELEALAGDANSEIVAAETIDVTFVDVVPSEPGTDGQYVIYVQEAQDTLYKYENAAWSIQVADANKLYFDTENNQLYSYVSATHKFMPVAVDNTIIFSGSITGAAAKTALNPIKTPGVYNVLQHQTSSGKTKMTNWVMTVTYLDSDEADELDGSVYQKLENNYTVYKRYYKPSTDTWTPMTKYYEGLVRDSLTSSAYYSWSINKIKSAIAAIPQLEAGDNIAIEDNKINAKGYLYDDEPKEELKLIDDILAAVGMPAGMSLGLKVSGAAGATTYTWTDDIRGAFAQLIQMGMLPGVGATYQTANGKSGVIAAVDATTITFEETLDADNALTNEPVDYVVDTTQLFSFAEGMYDYVDGDISTFGITLSGAAGATTYTYTDTERVFHSIPLGSILKLQDDKSAKLVSVDTINNTASFETTFDADNALANALIVTCSNKNYASGKYSHTEGGYEQFGIVSNNIASGQASHAEGGGTVASSTATHAEGFQTVASSPLSHAEGNHTEASGQASHAEGFKTVASSPQSHAEGYHTTASGEDSHAEGMSATASGEAAHAEGISTIAQNRGEHAEGVCNVSHTSTSSTTSERLKGTTRHSVGIGTNVFSDRKNAFEIMQNGDMYVLGAGNYDGTTIKAAGNSVKTLQDVISELNTGVSNAASTSYVTSAVDASQQLAYAYTYAGLATKQDTLTAGDNIVITNNVISAYVATNNEIDILFN